MASEKVDTLQLENAPPSRTTAAEELKATGYADACIQKQTLEILNGSAESRCIEKRYMRRLNMIILPTISALYFFEYLDRGNVGVSIR